MFMALPCRSPRLRNSNRPRRVAGKSRRKRGSFSSLRTGPAHDLHKIVWPNPLREGRTHIIRAEIIKALGGVVWLIERQPDLPAANQRIGDAVFTRLPKGKLAQNQGFREL